jgi:hypothetical protein
MEKKPSNKTAAILMTVAAIVVVGVALWLLRPVPQVHAAVKAVTAAQPAKSAPHVPPGATSAGDLSIATGPQTTATLATAVAAVSAATIPKFPPSTSPAVTPAAANQTAPSSPPAIVAPADEITASARMYAAHASLRTPEVSDPDSQANKQILRTMVLKVLAQSATPRVTTP